MPNNSGNAYGLTTLCPIKDDRKALTPAKISAHNLANCCLGLGG